MQGIDEANPKDIIGSRKPQLHLIPPSALVLEALVMELGAEKYSPFNWRDKPVSMNGYLSAIMRHVAQLLDGEDFDSESRISHLAHIRAGAGILIDAMETGNLIDNRPPKGAAARLIAQHTKAAPPTPTPTQASE